MALHDPRHTAASLVVSSGASVQVVQRLLGHASASTTLDVYADLFDQDLDAVADSLDAARTAALEPGINAIASGTFEQRMPIPCRTRRLSRFGCSSGRKAQGPRVTLMSKERQSNAARRRIRRKLVLHPSQRNRAGVDLDIVGIQVHAREVLAPAGAYGRPFGERRNGTRSARRILHRDGRSPDLLDHAVLDDAARVHLNPNVVDDIHAASAKPQPRNAPRGS